MPATAPWRFLTPPGTYSIPHSGFLSGSLGVDAETRILLSVNYEAERISDGLPETRIT